MSDPLRAIYLRLAGVVMLVIITALVATALLSHRSFEAALAPAMSAKVGAVGASVRSLILKAISNGADFKELYGIDQTFDSVHEDVPEVSYFAVTDTEGRVLHERLTAPEGAAAYFSSPATLAMLAANPAAGAAVHSTRLGGQDIISLPIVSPQGELGALHIGIDIRFIDQILLDMLYDVLVVLVVALFFTLELLHFMAGARLEASLRALGEVLERGATGRFSTPPRSSGRREFGLVLGLLEARLARINSAFLALQGRLQGAAASALQALTRQYRFGTDATHAEPDDSQLPKVRAPLFMFILSEELTRSFLPGYVKQLQVPIPGLSPEIVVGLPIALFMLIVAIGQPWIGAYSERAGARRTMLIGAAIAAAGMLASAFAWSVLDLLVWRSLCALGYGMVFVASQGYLLEHSTSASRARSFSLFIGAIMVASVCGPSIGGILADNLGIRPTFGIAALLALASMAVMRQLPKTRVASKAKAAAGRPPTLREIGSLLCSPRFMTVTGLAAMPAKILLTGLCFYLVPTYMLSIGANQAMTGRILMVYAVVMVLMGPLSASLANSRQRMEWLVGLGLIVSGLGGLLLLAGGQIGWVFATVLLVGLGQSLSMSAQSALVAERCPADVARLGELQVYGVYRLLERMGNAIGPLLAGALVVTQGYRQSFVLLGALTLVCGLLFLWATVGSREQPRLEVAQT